MVLPNPDTLFKSYLTLAALAPIYPLICLANDSIEEQGYYYFIPQILLPIDQRPHSNITQWPGLENKISHDCNCNINAILFEPDCVCLTNINKPKNIKIILDKAIKGSTNTNDALILKFISKTNKIKIKPSEII